MKIAEIYEYNTSNKNLSVSHRIQIMASFTLKRNLMKMAHWFTLFAKKNFQITQRKL